MTHPTITKEQAVQLARKAGFSVDSTPWFASLERFAQAIYKLGRNAGLEAAKQHVLHANDECVGCPDGPDEFAASIESLKDNTP